MCQSRSYALRDLELQAVNGHKNRIAVVLPMRTIALGSPNAAARVLGFQLV